MKHFKEGQMFRRAALMGILNVTPDSFFETSRCTSIERALERAYSMKEEGADWIDIGGESTRPFSEPVPLQEELSRVVPLFSSLANFPLPLSIDTQKHQVARACVELGATMINDVSGFSDDAMIDVAKDHPNTELCVMHSQRSPKEMQIAPSYPLGVVQEIYRFFSDKIALLTACGIEKGRIILDPGIGFGKTVAHNLEILQNLPVFQSLGCRLLVGISRKSFMTRALGLPTGSLLPATVALNGQLIRDGVDIIRVHDVLDHKKMIDG